MLLDVVLIGLAYYLAHALVFGPMGEDPSLAPASAASLPVLVFLKLAALLAVGVYRGLWRYVGIGDLMVLRARRSGRVGRHACSSSCSPFASRAARGVVFVLDGLLLFLLVAGSRIAFRCSAACCPPRRGGAGRRVLIFGAGDAGELLLRELRNNPALRCLPVGFADDDPLKRGGSSTAAGLRRQRVVLDHLPAARGRRGNYSSARVPQKRLNEILRECRKGGIRLNRLRFELEDISPQDL